MFFSGVCFAATYNLEIIQPQAGLTTASRYYKTYTGLEYKVRVGVIGGLYPFTFSLSVNPSGMTIDSETGIITWSNPVEAGSPHSVTVSVTDDESTNVTRSWTITVSTSGFYFVDGDSGTTNAGGGDGSQGNPWLTLDDLLEAGSVSSGTQAYFMTGTYGTTGLSQSGGGGWIRHEIGGTKPLIWLAYPGETPEIDFGSTDYTDPEICLRFTSSSKDVYIAGFAIDNPWNFAFQTGPDANRMVIAWNSFTNLRNAQNGQNSAFIMSVTNYGPTRDFFFLHNNSFANLFDHVGQVGGAMLKFYSEDKALIEANSFSNENGDNDTSKEGISMKADNRRITLRKNTVDYISNHSIGGSANGNVNNVIEFNLVTNCGTGDEGGIVINEFNTIVDREDYYRNTFNCKIVLRNGTTGDGPFYFTDNVIVNEQSGTPTDSHITHHAQVVDHSVVEISGDLTGYAVDGIIDANGDLQGDYLQYVGTKGYQTSVEAVPTDQIQGVNIGSP